MKKLLLALLIVVSIVTLGILEQIFLSRILDDTIKLSNGIIDSLNDEDWTHAQKQMDELNLHWLNNKLYFELMFSHNEFRDIPLLLGELGGYIEVHDKDQGIVRARIIINDAKNHANTLSYRIENIL